MMSGDEVYDDETTSPPDVPPGLTDADMRELDPEPPAEGPDMVTADGMIADFKVGADAQLRKCIGSERYGIAPHLAPVADFSKQPSQKDGLSRLCTVHWKAYVAGLGRDRKAKLAGQAAAKATKPAATSAIHPVPKPSAKRTTSRGGRQPEPIRTRQSRRTAK